MFLYDSFYCHGCVFYDFLLIFSGPSKSVEDLIYFFGHVCYRLFFFASLMFQDDDIGRAVWTLLFWSVDTFSYSDQSILLFFVS